MDSAELFRVWTEEVWNAGLLDRATDCLGDTYTRHDPVGNRTVTREQYIDEIRSFRERFSDIHFTVEDISVTEDRIWNRHRMTATDSASGESVVASVLQLYRVEGGRLVETWAASAPEGHDWSGPIE